MREFKFETGLKERIAVNWDPRSFGNSLLNSEVHKGRGHNSQQSHGFLHAFPQPSVLACVKDRRVDFGGRWQGPLQECYFHH
jgi:hypothetical protein